MARQQTKKLAAVTTGAADHPAFPARWCYGLYVISLGHRAFLPPSSRLSRQRNLSPASGRQDHTISPSASAPFVRTKNRARRCRGHRIPASRIVTIARAPLSIEAGWPDHASVLGERSAERR